MTTTATGQTTGPEDNPLVEGLERLPVHPTALVIFGATGDLARRKLLPALYNLAHEGALPERFHLIGSSRSDMPHGDFRDLTRESVESHSRRKPDEKVLEEMIDDVRFVGGSFDDDSVYEQIAPVSCYRDVKFVIVLVAGAPRTNIKESPVCVGIIATPHDHLTCPRKHNRRRPRWSLAFLPVRSDE